MIKLYLIELIFFFIVIIVYIEYILKEMDDIKIDGIYMILIASTTSKLLWESQIVFLN